MIKKPVLKRFLKEHIVPEFDRFFLHQDEWLIRITSIFVHGIYFQRSGIGDVLYVHCFVSSLTSGIDFIGLTIEEEVPRADKPEY